MARPKKDITDTTEEIVDNKPNKITKDFIDSLIKDTDFVLAESGSLMSSRGRVTTPLYAINCIYGGGIPLSLITRISGFPGSGKSTFSYQCMANYQKEYPDGVPVIYDMEASMDNSRLQVLGVDTSKVLRLKATTLQDAFTNMFKMLEKLKKLRKDNPELTTFQVYDTLSTGGTNKQVEAIEKGEQAFGQGTMMEAPRIIKQNFANLFPYIEEIPMFMGFLEQVFTQQNGPYAMQVAASGNFALKHDAHIHIVFGSPKDEYERGFMVGTTSMVKLEKSKLSPKFTDIPCYIDVTQGGKIDPIVSFLKYISSSNIGIVKASSWWSISDTINQMFEEYPMIDKDITKYDKSYRSTEFIELARQDEDLINLLQVRFIDFINGIYPGQRSVNNEYRKEIMGKCKYFKDCNTDNIPIKIDEETGEVLDV